LTYGKVPLGGHQRHEELVETVHRAERMMDFPIVFGVLLYLFLGGRKGKPDFVAVRFVAFAGFADEHEIFLSTYILHWF